jgi:hypothetical protein
MMYTGQSWAQRLAMDQAFDLQAEAPGGGRGRVINGYRRVVGPGVCDFCALIAGQLYVKGQLMPAHANCRCSVAPIVNGVDPARRLNQRRLRAGQPSIVQPGGYEGGVGQPAEPARPARPTPAPAAAAAPAAGLSPQMQQLIGRSGLGHVADEQAVWDAAALSLDRIDPQYIEKLGRIGIEKMPAGFGTASGLFSPYSEGVANVVRVHPNQLTDIATQRNNRSMKLPNNFFAPGKEGTTALQHTLTHELGHFLDRQMPRVDSDRARGAALKAAGIDLNPRTLNRQDTSRNAFTGLTEAEHGKLARALSKYGSASPTVSSNANEMMAEAWTEYVLSDKPRPVAKAVGDIIIKSLGKK